MKSAKRNAWDKIKVVVAFALFASLFTAFAFEEWRISQHIPKPTGEIAKSSQVGYLQKYSTYCAAKPAHENDKWQHDFWCDFKFTDFIMAAFTVALVFVTGGLIVVGIFQNRQLSRQIKLAREEFISTHRPRLIVRQFQVDPVVAGQPITVHLAMINIGDTDALPNLIACEVALWNNPAQHFEPPGIDKVQKTINVGHEMKD